MRTKSKVEFRCKFHRNISERSNADEGWGGERLNVLFNEKSERQDLHPVAPIRLRKRMHFGLIRA